MAPSKVEVNFLRLLSQCEKMAEKAQDEHKKPDWRLEKYVEALQKQIADIGKSTSNHPDQDVMREYVKKVEFLKGFLAAEKKTSVPEKALATQQMIPSQSISSQNLQDKNSQNKTKEIHLKAKSHVNKEMRHELFEHPPGHKRQHDSSDIRKRKGGTDIGEENLDGLLQHHQNMQEKIAEEMIEMAKSMKHNSVMAANLIKEDNKVLQSSSKVAESNFAKLKTESERLEEITNQPCSLWVWVMLMMVCVVFLMMIVFIRLFPKRY